MTKTTVKGPYGNTINSSDPYSRLSGRLGASGLGFCVWGLGFRVQGFWDSQGSGLILDQEEARNKKGTLFGLILVYKGTQTIENQTLKKRETGPTLGLTAQV